MQAVADVNGPLMTKLASQLAYHDLAAPDVFRDGCPLIGQLPRTGNGEHIAPRKHSKESVPSYDEIAAGILLDGKPATKGELSEAMAKHKAAWECSEEAPLPRSIRHFVDTRVERNLSLLAKLRDDPRADELWQMASDDAHLNRMTDPKPVTQEDIEDYSFSPRFCIEQGVRSNGLPKLRAIDDFTRSGINELTLPSEKLKCDGLDTLFQTAKHLHRATKCPLGIWKADIASAYRRIPIARRHRDLAAVVFRHHGTPHVSVHTTLPFGSIASVHGWDRVGSFLFFLGVKLLHLPLGRYVDDFWAVDRLECAETAMQCFARLVRLLMGETAIAPEKLETGTTITVLGADCSTLEAGLKCRATDEKKAKWIGQIKGFLKEGRLNRGCASKLAGALQWATQFMFNRLGRAMIRPIYKQIKSCDGKIDRELELSLRWWLQVLSLDITQTRGYEGSEEPCCHLFSDARSTPPRVAAVLFIDGKTFSCDMEPSAELVKSFRPRNDDQIMALEILSIAVGALARL